MKISALRLFNVKRFANRGVAIEGIGDGVNMLCAVNEFGKSTSFEALHALFFQPHSSGSGDIKNLRPYSGGSPVIEADVSIADGRFRITKQYFGGKSARVTELATGRLVAQADEAENFIASLIKGGAAGPAGLLWVRQGVMSIERRSRSEEDGERQVRQSLLQSVQGEVEAVTGGRRMAEIMDAAEAARSQLVTLTGRPKTGGRYAVAIDERDRLATEEQRLKDEVNTLRTALDRRASDTKRLTELDKAEDRQERRNAITTAQQALDAAKEQNATLKTAEVELKLVRERRNAAGRDLDLFRNAVEKAKALNSSLLVAERRRDEAVDKRSAAGEAIAKARLAAEAAEAEEKVGRDLLARLAAAEEARHASEHLAALEEQLSKAEAVRQALEEGEAKLKLVTISPEAIDELQGLEIELAKRRAIEEAGRPSVSITYDADAASLVTMDGDALPDQVERTYDAQARLSMPGIGTITLRSNRPIRSDDGLAQAEARRRMLLAAMGVDNLAAARQRQIRAQELAAGQGELRGRLSQLAPDGLPKLREAIVALGSVGVEGAPELKEDPAQVRASHTEARERVDTTRQALREMEPLRGNADDAFVTAETTMASLTAERAQVDAVLGPEDGRSERGRVLSGTLDELDRSLAQAEMNAQRLRATTADLKSVEAALTRARSVDEAAEKAIAALRESIAGLNAEIRARSEDAVEEKWRETIEALSAIDACVAAFENEVAVLQRLSSALESAKSEARDLYLKPVMAELRPLLGLLFDDVSITFDDKTLLPHTILRNGQEEDVDRLSGGMREQLSVLTRLAFARLLARDGRPTPVILDDALVYSDDDRIEKMFDALHRQSSDQQIIVFSCRQRAFQKLGGHILQMTNWSP